MTEKMIKRIEMLCSNAGVSIAQMLREANLNESLIDNMKKGSVPSVDKVSAIADYFHVPTDYIIGKEIPALYDMSQIKELAHHLNIPADELIGKDKKEIRVLEAEKDYLDSLKEAGMENLSEQEILISLVRSATRYLSAENFPVSYSRVFWRYYDKRIAELGE